MLLEAVELEDAMQEDAYAQACMKAIVSRLIFNSLQSNDTFQIIHGGVT